jgi:hypothetical protein
MDASEATGTQRGLPPPVAAAHSEAGIDPPAAAVPEQRPQRRVLVVVLAVWALVLAGEIGYVIGRDRTSSRPAAARIDGSPGEFIVLQAIAQSLQDRLDAAEKALADPQAKPSTPAVVQVPLQSLDPLGGAPLLAYSGTLLLASCTGSSDPSKCPAQNNLVFTITRLADGTLAMSSALFDGAPVARAGGVLRAQGQVTNPANALTCPAATMATYFDAQLTPDQLTLTNGVPAISSFSATLTISAPAESTCTQRLQAVYQGTIAHS